jgi:hypothetical protein
VRAVTFNRLVVGAVLLLAALAIADALRPGPADDPLSSPNETIAIPERHVSADREIEAIAEKWARRFAAHGADDCFHTSQQLCEQLQCVHVGGYKLPNCRLPTRAYRASFDDAHVENVSIQSSRAKARFSNGEAIVLHGDGGTWTIIALGRKVGSPAFDFPDASVAPVSPERQVRATGKLWASAFAKGNDDCNYMTQPLCERVVCARLGPFERAKCKPVTRAYRRSFKRARIVDVALEGEQAVILFSNGKVVRLQSAGGSWLIANLGVGDGLVE